MIFAFLDRQFIQILFTYGRISVLLCSLFFLVKAALCHHLWTTTFLITKASEFLRVLKIGPLTRDHIKRFLLNILTVSLRVLFYDQNIFDQNVFDQNFSPTAFVPVRTASQFYDNFVIQGTDERSSTLCWSKKQTRSV